MRETAGILIPVTVIYFFQSEAHNVVLFNGKGQSREQQYHGSMLRGYLHYLLDADNVKYVLANGTGPYSDQFSS